MRSNAAVGKRLTLLREALGLSQKDMAKVCKIKTSLWNHYENGNRPLTRVAIFKIIDGTHGAVDANYLLEGKIDGVRHSLAIKLQEAA